MRGTGHRTSFDHAGSAPRVRGTSTVPRRHGSRFIPAPAGNSSEFSDDRGRDATGSSPRVRGNGWYRSIAPTALTPVHPRACGERVEPSSSAARHVGSSPRVRGTPHFMRTCTIGSSVHPRACGETVQARRPISGAAGRFIPACAGNRISERWLARQFRFIPARAGNAMRRPPDDQTSVHPRVRGERHARRAADDPRRFIPARAGNSPVGRAASFPSVHPRACGEHGSQADARAGMIARFIPACAGNTAMFAAGRGGVGSSPRVRGTRSARCHGAHAGSSPRLRGNASAGNVRRGDVGSSRACGERV